MIFLFTPNQYYNILEPDDRRIKIHPFYQLKCLVILEFREVWDIHQGNLQKCTNWKKTVPDIFFTDACEKGGKEACGMCSVQEVPISLASVGLSQWDFFVANSDHATTVEGHGHQGIVCSCGLGNLLLANCGLLRKTCTSTCNVCFRMLCMYIPKIRRKKKKLINDSQRFYICEDDTHLLIWYK